MPKQKDSRENKNKPKATSLSSEEIRAQALRNMSAAREALGEDTIKRMADTLRKNMREKK